MIYIYIHTYYLAYAHHILIYSMYMFDSNPLHDNIGDLSNTFDSSSAQVGEEMFFGPQLCSSTGMVLLMWRPSERSIMVWLKTGISMISL